MTQTQSTTAGPATVPHRAPDTTRFACFDGYRALAAMSVLVYHVAFSDYVFRRHTPALGPLFARFDVGVAIFFLVSGFLLYRPFVVAHLERRPGPDVRSFARRRLLRIFPAYWFVLTIGALVPTWAPDVWTARGAPIFYGLIQIYIPGRDLGGLGQAWSIATELSFYAFLPLYAWLLGRRRRSPRRQMRLEITGAVMLYVSSFGFRLVVDTFFPRRDEMKLWLLGTSDLFALGIGLAVVSAWCAHRRQEPRIASHPAFPAVAWLIAAAAFWVVAYPLDLGLFPFKRVSFGQELGRQTLYGLVAFFLLLPGVFGPMDRGRIRRALQHRTVQFVGLVSYGIYLWHPWLLNALIRWMGRPPPGTREWSRTFQTYDPIPFVLLLLVTALFTIAVAWLTHVLVERPFLRMKHRRPVAREAAAGAVSRD
jgi:peptidoglycan/LPS O-acetylase OafA/YrhL